MRPGVSSARRCGGGALMGPGIQIPAGKQFAAGTSRTSRSLIPLARGAGGNNRAEAARPHHHRSDGTHDHVIADAKPDPSAGNNSQQRHRSVFCSPAEWSADPSAASKRFRNSSTHALRGHRPFWPRRSPAEIGGGAEINNETLQRERQEHQQKITKANAELASTDQQVESAACGARTNRQAAGAPAAVEHAEGSLRNCGPIWNGA